METLFRSSNFLVLPFWAMMILLPRWRWTKRIVRSPLISAAPATFYVALVLPRLGEIWPAVARPTLGGVMSLLGSPTGATIAWVHFLAFDLLVGRWIYLDAEGRRLSPWLTSPILFLTLMLGPAGFLFYLVIRPVTRFGKDRVERPDSTDPEAENRSPSLLGAAKSTQRKVKGPALLRHALGTSAPLTWLGGTMILLLMATTVGLLVDHRVVTGAPAWLKPSKFAISVSLYSFSFVWLLGFIQTHPRLVRLAANVTVASFIVEMIAIVTQAARGTTSHFNMSTPFDSFLWMTMGAFIALVWAMNLLTTILLLRQPLPDRAFASALRLGLVISLVGMAVAFPMVRPTAAQRPYIAAGLGPRIVGAHSVGVADGGPGLPIVGWSTVAGDLRVAHFVGLHGLQLLPILGWLVSRPKWAARLKVEHRLSIVRTIGFAYLAVVLLLAGQALRGQSVIHSDDNTTAVALAIASFATISVLATIAHAFGADRSSPYAESRPLSETRGRTLPAAIEEKP